MPIMTKHDETDTAGPLPSRAALPPPPPPLATATGATVAATAPAPFPNKTIWLAFYPLGTRDDACQTPYLPTWPHGLHAMCSCASDDSHPRDTPHVISARRNSVPDIITTNVETRRPWKFVDQL